MRVIFVFLLLGLCATTQAQPTLNAADFPTSPLATDSCRTTLSTAALPPLLATYGGTWDLSGIPDSNVFLSISHLPDPFYRYADSQYFPIAGIWYAAALRKDVNSVGMQEFGRSVAPWAHPLWMETAGMTDTLWIDGQFDPYSIPRTTLRFPANYGSSWTSEYYEDFHLHVSLETDSIVRMPGVVREYVVETNTIVGWGKMRVPDASGHPSAFFDVLQIRVETATLDSVLMQDPVRNPVMELILRIPQGRRDTQYRQVFVMAGPLVPLAIAEFSSSSNPIPKRITTLTRAGMNGVAQIEAALKPMYYPNPCSAGALLHGVGNGGFQEPQLLKLVNPEGKTIELERETGGWRVPNGVTPGFYYLPCPFADAAPIGMMLKVE